MCTAFKFVNGDFYFGRNLDLDYDFGQKVVIIPRNFPVSFRDMPSLKNHHCIIGMATVIDGYPLMADAHNEHGLAMAGLNFPGYAAYSRKLSDKLHNVASFEIILWILGQCSSVDEAEKLLSELNMTDRTFRDDIPNAQLHWIISDRKRSIVLEVTEKGVNICENPVEVLTNSPEFGFHITSLTNYMGMSPHQPENRFSEKLSLSPFGQGFGAFGIPGDSSPNSRFIKAAFLKENSECKKTEDSSVSQVFHILSSVEMVKGSIISPSGSMDITEYSTCMNVTKGIYYYKTYENSRINAVFMHNVDMDSDSLFTYELENKQSYNMVN